MSYYHKYSVESINYPGRTLPTENLNMTIYRTEEVESTEFPGWVLQVERHYDGDHEPPWERDYGCVAVEVRRGRYTGYGSGYEKAAGEVIIHDERGSLWVVDFAKEVKRARAESWGISPEMDLETRKSLVYRALTPGLRNLVRGDALKARADCISLTKGQVAVAAVRGSMDYCQRWLRGEWHYGGLVVTVVKSPAGIGFDDEAESCWGFDSDAKEYLKESMQALGSELIRRFIRAAAEETVAEAARASAVQRVKAALQPVTVQQLGGYLEVPADATVRSDGWVSAWVRAPQGMGE